MIPWNKGLTKEIDSRVAKECLSKEHKKAISIALTGKKRKPMTEERKRLQSEKMKLAHKEGRAWNIGKARRNHQPSYAEIFFKKMIDNEFEDKKYEIELPFSRYAIDFAWIHKKKAIEIDGEQHFRFIERQRVDHRKTLCLISEGWKVLRISWRAMLGETRRVIDIAKEFIHTDHNDRFVMVREELDKVIIDDKALFQEYKEEVMKFVKRRQLRYCSVCNKECLGKICKSCIKEKQKLDTQKRIDLVLNSKIDFTKWGWTGRVSKLTGLRYQKIRGWMKKNLPHVQIKSLTPVYEEIRCIKCNEIIERISLGSSRKIQKERRICKSCLVKGKSLEEIYGIERAKIMRERLRDVWRKRKEASPHGTWGSFRY